VFVAWTYSDVHHTPTLRTFTTVGRCAVQQSDSLLPQAAGTELAIDRASLERERNGNGTTKEGGQGGAGTGRRRNYKKNNKSLAYIKAAASAECNNVYSS